MFNNSSNLYGSEWLALVFSNRNKNYGAYALRSQSSRILLKALFIVAPAFIMLFVGPMLYANLHKSPPMETRMELPVTMDNSIIEVSHEEIKKEKPAEAKAEPMPVEPAPTTKFTSSIVVTEDAPLDPPTSDQIKNTVIGSVTQEGEGSKDNALPVTKGNGTSGDSDTPGSGGNEVYETAGIEAFPEFPGGMAAWSKFMEKNLRYPYAAQDAGVSGKVYISFVVEKDGSITDVKVTRGIGYGCDDEAVRVIKKSPRWKPGIQNKQNVRVRYNMPINYALSN